MSAGTTLFTTQRQNAHWIQRAFLVLLAERGGFEPPVGYEPTHAFQACDLNHSSISPEFVWAMDQTKLRIIAKLPHILRHSLTKRNQKSLFKARLRMNFLLLYGLITCTLLLLPREISSNGTTALSSSRTYVHARFSNKIFTADISAKKINENSEPYKRLSSHPRNF